MNPRWLLSLLILLLVSCSTGCSGATPTDPVLDSPTVESTQMEETEEVLTPTNTITPTATQEVVPPPTQVDTETPVPTTAPVIVPTLPQIILTNPSPIIAKTEGGKDWIFYLVGASQNGSWISAADMGPVLEEEADYQLLTDLDEGSHFNGRHIVYEQICDQYYVNTEPFSLSEAALGVSGYWPLRPRTVVKIPTKHPIYKEALATWLLEQSSSDPIPMISKIWQVDVEGNGTDEVFINASYFVDPTGHNVEPRNYSVLLMRTVVGNEVATVKLVGDYYSEAAVNQFPLTYTLEFIADLNEDGRMEVVVSVSRWEGSGFMVFEIDGAQAQLVLSVMCSL